MFRYKYLLDKLYLILFKKTPQQSRVKKKSKSKAKNKKIKNKIKSKLDSVRKKKGPTDRDIESE